MEIGAESLADYETSREAFADPEFGRWFEQMADLVDSGERQIFAVAA